jgi:hypothetical protein
MRELKHPIKITHKEFERGLKAAALLDDKSLKERTGGRAARSYYVRQRHDGRAISLKLVLRLAFQLAEKPWGKLNSENAARQLRDEFDIIHITDKSKPEGTAADGIPTFSPEAAAAARMFQTMLKTVKNANGQIAEKAVKVKVTSLSESDWNELWPKMLNQQKSCCALTRLPLGFDGECEDQEMLASLDRIDSKGHYTVDNLQIVCRFINRWKCADNNDLALRLIGDLRKSVV